MFESLIDDMSHPKEAKNDPYRLEPASNTDTGMWVWNQSLNIPNYLWYVFFTNFNSVIILI